MGLDARKPALVHEKNKGADQPTHLCVESDQCLCQLLSGKCSSQTGLMPGIFLGLILGQIWPFPVQK